jgi:hypothetical protein
MLTDVWPCGVVGDALASSKRSGKSTELLLAVAPPLTHFVNASCQMPARGSLIQNEQAHYEPARWVQRQIEQTGEPVALRASSMLMHLEAIRAGTGRGVLPCYVGDGHPLLERLTSCGDESARCSGSSRPDPHSVFSTFIPTSTTPSTVNAISSLGRRSGSSGPKQPPNGKLRLRPHENSVRPR